jgi:hypothetical protein
VKYDLQQAGDAASLTHTVTLERIAGCGGGDCPTVYRTDRDTLVIQGYAFEPANAGVDVPAGEQMVEIPVELLAGYLRTTTT